MWKDAPASIGAGAPEHDDDDDAEEEEEEKAGLRRRGLQLQDEEGFCYFGPADKIHALLDVELYVPVVPLAPLEELHVQRSPTWKPLITVPNLSQKKP